jgi:acetylornithine deacetylase/succinyl-diaminopimelate desuccinylase-like protein
VASGLGRLGTFLSELIADVLRVLDATPAPRGHEHAAATALRDWCAGRWPELGWTLQPYGDGGANLVASCGAGPVLYSHLDTSLDGVGLDGVGLDGAAPDVAVTGRADAAGPLVVDGDRVEGFGLGVARAPAAAALAAFLAARRGTLLLAGSGTHRRGGRADGVLAYLQSSPAPPSAIVAKCGPPTVLFEEPGAAYLRVRVSGRYGAALAPESAVPAGGVAVHAGVVLDALAAWREDYLRARPPVGQVGPQAGVGAVRSGWAAKPDLLPAELLVDLYVVTVPGEDLAVLRGQLDGRLRAALAGSALSGCALDVSVEPIHAAAATAPGAPIVRAARAAWADEFGEPPPAITGWTGSTDGVVFRAHGIDAVRLGPQSARSPADPRRDVVQLADLDAFTRVYAELLRSGLAP